jgi:hypothetical protein
MPLTRLGCRGRSQSPVDFSAADDQRAISAGPGWRTALRPISSASAGRPPGAESGHETVRPRRAVRSRSVTESEPVIREVLSFEPLPPGQKGSRRAVVRWSDGRIAEARRWWDDEILICDGDLVGKSASQVRALHFHRDRDFLQSSDR